MIKLRKKEEKKIKTKRIRDEAVDADVLDNNVAWD
jgi:hypothetical protein